MFSKNVIDLAGQLRTNGLVWQDVAETLTKSGHITLDGKKIHNHPLCIKVLEDPQWSHLREHRLFSVNKLNIIKQAMKNVGIADTDIDKVITVIGG